MDTLCLVLARVLDAALYPAALAGEAAAATWAGALAGGLAAAAFLALAPLKALDRARADLAAALLEIWIYRRRPRVALRAEMALAGANLRLLGRAALPLAASLLAAAPVLVQAPARFGRTAAPVGQPLVVEVEPTASGPPPAARPSTASRPSAAAGPDADLSWVEGSGPIVGPVRQTGPGRLTWRVTPAAAGALALRLQVGSGQVRVPLVAGHRSARLAPVLTRGPGRLLHPRAPGLDPRLPVVRVAVGYPSAGAAWLGWLGLGSALGAATAAALRQRLPGRRA